MRIGRLAAVVAVAAVALGMGACGKEGTPAPSGGAAASDGPVSDKCTTSGVTFTPASNVTVAGSPTFDKMKAAGKATIGVKFDQPNLGYKDADGKRCGFDIEIAQLVAAKLGFDPAKIEYKEIATANRETSIKGAEIDYYVGTYSITDKRKLDVSFAGPYFVAGQDLLVRRDDSSITGKDTLKGIQRVRENKLTEDANIVEFKTYSECVSQLLDQKVDTVTTDDAILKGYAAQNPAKLKVVGQPFSIEKYGIGLPRDDKALRDAVNEILATSVTDGTWKKIYDGTLGKSGSPANVPSLERY
jgi:glutamate transport system substrate-binding protein